MLAILKSLWLICLVVTLTLGCCFIILLLRIYAWLRGVPPYQDLGHEIGVFWGRVIFACTPGWSLDIYGQENIPTTKGAFVIASNHESAVDIFSIFALGLQFRWLGKESMFRVPAIGAAMQHNGYIPIRRGDKESHKRALAQCDAYLRAGTPILFFPEGTRSTTGHIGPFKIGAFKLAKENTVPILPVVLKGAGKLLKKKSWLPQSALLQIHILPPMLSSESESIDQFMERVRIEMVAVHES